MPARALKPEVQLNNAFIVSGKYILFEVEVMLKK